MVEKVGVAEKVFAPANVCAVVKTIPESEAEAPCMENNSYFALLTVDGVTTLDPITDIHVLAPMPYRSVVAPPNEDPDTNNILKFVYASTDTLLCEVLPNMSVF